MRSASSFWIIAVMECGTWRASSRFEITGVAITKMGKRHYGDAVIENTDPRGRKYYWIGGEGGALNEDIPGSDCNAVLLERLAAVTPLHLDSTHDPVLQELRSWTVPGYEKEPRP